MRKILGGVAVCMIIAGLTGSADAAKFLTRKQIAQLKKTSSVKSAVEQAGWFYHLSNVKITKITQTAQFVDVQDGIKGAPIEIHAQGTDEHGNRVALHAKVAERFASSVIVLNNDGTVSLSREIVFK